VPVGADDTVTTTVNTAIDIDVGGNDYDPDDPINPLTFTDFDGASHGTLTYRGAGVVGYDPADDFIGVDTFTYNVSDVAGDTVNVTVTVYVIESTNQAPTAVDDNATTQQNSALTLNFSSYLANDTDPDNDSLTITGVAGAVNGQVIMDAGNETVTFTPDTGFSGNGSFTYTVSDGNGGTDTATVNISVTGYQAIFSEGFESGTNGWSFDSESSITTNNSPHSGSNHAEMVRRGEATRIIDMSGVTGAQLTFWWKANSLDNNEDAYVEIFDGSWHTLLAVADNQDDNSYHSETYDISGYNMTSTFQIRLRTDGNGYDDYFYIDDIEIIGYR
jgi:hypothetical protein